MRWLVLTLAMIQGVCACATTNTNTQQQPFARDVIGLNDSRFASANVRQGVWLPDTFRDRVQGGIYFLEGRDPRRMPVLFIHGIYGSPRDFHALIASLDRQRFQPCVYFYASGARLNYAAQQLAKELRGLRTVDGFKEIALVAHSMGGLNARDVLINHSQESVDVPILVTISTPWNGHAGASFGARFAPMMVPAWSDLARGSPYLEALFVNTSNRRRLLPENVHHHLIFTYGRRWSSLGVSSDEVVTVASQLSKQAQGEASRIYGFNTTHARILEDATLAQLLNRILSAYELSADEI